MASDLVVTAKDIRLLSESERLKTFKNWPNEVTGNCTPEKLAEAGFYHVPSYDSPDNVRCIFCLKELDGWEVDDEPRQEHKKHSRNCTFLSLPQSSLNLERSSVRDFFFVVQELMVARFEAQTKEFMKNFDVEADATRQAIIDHVMGNR